MKGLDLPSPKCVILLGAAQFSPVLSRRRGCHQCLPQDSRYQVSTAARYLCLFHRAPINHIVMPYFWSKHDSIAALRRRRGASGSRNGRSEGQVIGVSSEGPRERTLGAWCARDSISQPRELPRPDARGGMARGARVPEGPSVTGREGTGERQTIPPRD
jgi:hypothetical protein